MKRVISVLLVLALLCTVLPQFTLGANAAGIYEAHTVVSLAKQKVNFSYANDYCLRFIAELFSGAYGLYATGYTCCAYHNGDSYIDSPSRETIPLGACVYFGGCAYGDEPVWCDGVIAGHIGVYIGNDQIIHAWAGRIVCTTIDHVINCGYSYRGYGWYANQPLSSESIPVSAYDVATGGVNSVQVVGWAYDPDTPSESLEIHVYMDGVYIGKGVANTLREDVNAVYGCGNYHGFDITVPVTVAETGNHFIEVYALNTNTSGGNAYLGSKEVTITAHTHSYAESVTQAATCTQAGVKTYTCESCADTYAEEIPAIGHNYISEVIGATCTTVGHTAFTCERCGDRYVEMSDGWSEWSTEYPTGIPEHLIEAKIQYSTLEKEYTTSTSDTLDGWTLYNTESGWSDYGEWSAWSDTPVSESDTVMVEQRTLWLYYYYLCPTCGDHMHGQGCYTWAGGCGSSIDWTAAREIWSTVAWESAGLQDWYGTGKYNAYIDGELVFKWTDNYGNGKTKTQFRSRTREKVDRYYFCRWPDEWSDWSDTAVESSEDIQVKTQTVYRYYIGELAPHNYSYAVTKVPTAAATGVLTGTCTVCSGTTTKTLPKLSTTDYTYSQIKAPSYTETGVGRYTWNTTTYGTFIFDVILERIANTGDLDGTGTVDEGDVIYLLQYLLMPEDFPVNQYVDYDKDNDVDEEDVIYLLQHLLMPEEFPL